MAKSAKRRPRTLAELAQQPKLAELDELDLSGWALTSLRQLPALPRLRKLNLSDNPLRSLDGIENAPELEQLSVDAKDLKALPQLRALQVLMVSTSARDLTWAKLPRLRYLSVVAPLRSLDGLDQLSDLGELVVHDAKLDKLPSIAHPALWKLILPRCALRRVPKLAVPSLIILHLQDNEITSLENLEGAPALEQLAITGNPLTELAGLEHLPSLQQLHVDGRIVKTISSATHAHLSALPQLRLLAKRVGTTPYADFAAKKQLV